MKTVVLMYHGLYENDLDLQHSISAEDRPYAVERSVFKKHLELIGRQSESPNGLNIVITFDDGHISNHSMALPDLQDADLSAYFFVTSDFSEKRDYFCRPEHLLDLHKAGMTVGSHGASHRFLDDDLSRDELQREFEESASYLKKAIGDDVHSISFPGGRYSENSLELASVTGYRQLFGSQAGVNNSFEAVSPKPILRVAIKRTTLLTEVEQILTADAAYYSKIAFKQFLKNSLRKILGNKLYHGLYKSLAG